MKPPIFPIMTQTTEWHTAFVQRIFHCCLLLNLHVAATAAAPFLSPPPPDTFVMATVLECGDDSLQLCTNLTNLGGTPSSVFACNSPVNGSLTVQNDTCFFYHPIEGFSGSDTACIIVCNNQNLCDTFYFDIFVESCEQCADIPYDLLTLQLDDCAGTAKICNPFPLGEALLYDYQVNGLPYAGNVGICTFDTLYSYSYGSIPGGGNAGPYELQSWLIDGIAYSGAFQNIHELVDLMNMLDLAGDWQLDTVTLNIISFNTTSDYGQMTIVQTASNDLAILSKNSTTAPVGSSIYLPTGVHEVTLQHQLDDQCVDTFTAVVYCHQSATLYDTVTVNETKTFCPDTANLPGVLQAIDASCNNCQFVSFTASTDCVAYTGKGVGTDRLLITACDQYGVCDSTTAFITVVNSGQLPVAHPDRDTIFENTTSAWGLLDNDQLNGELKNIFILQQPQNGSLQISTDFDITYTPDDGFCGWDGITYQICNENGCDTTTATMLVRCKAPLIYQGFSPNADGKNDTFTIFDIENFPQNSLRVFNRWGNLIYQKDNYQNDWDGTSMNGELLPDGTYFYLFEINDREHFSGYVQLNR